MEEKTSFEPKDNNYLVGFEESEKMFLEAWKNKSLHQSWLISGIKGIGKTTFAYKLARFLLSDDAEKKEDLSSLDISPDCNTFRQIAKGSHPEFKLIERGYLKTERQKIVKAIKDGNYMSDEELASLKKSNIISVDDVRTINEFLSKKSADGKWRVVLIDSVDEMNSSSANAILKILEEPPHKSLILLISHNPALLLPTIKSRCNKLHIAPLKENQVASLLRRYRANLSEDVIKKIASISGGSIGKAISYVDGGALAIYDEIYALATSGKNFKTADMLSFCNNAVADDENYRLVKELILKFLSEQVRALNKVEETTDVYEKAVKTFKETEGLNLDRKQAIMTIMVAICRIY